MFKRVSTVASALVALASLAHAEGVPFEPGRWDVTAKTYRFEEHLGRPSLYLENGKAWVRDSRLENGVIEFDVAFDEDFGFDGVMWRAADTKSYEEFYLRAHLSGKPDACQYNPVLHELSGWQIYAGPRFSAPLHYAFGRWMHVKLVVSGGQADVYLDSDTPVFHMPELKGPPVAGLVGLTSSAGPAWFSSFRYEPQQAPQVSGAPAPEGKAPEGTVTTWRVSSPFDEARLKDQTRLPADPAGLGWANLKAEERGIANLARLHGRDKGSDTVFAAITIRSDGARLVPIRFGFSDRVRVYLNGSLLYAGNDGYRTRDYRFLGTVGLFDTLALPLRAGPNELRFAVSESFGGWAVAAALPDRDGLQVEP